jgi:hypothetical protein
MPFVFVGLIDVSPFLLDFLAFVILGNIALQIAAIDADIIVQRSNGRHTDGDRIAAKRAAFQWNVVTAIDRFGSAFGTCAVFHDGLLLKEMFMGYPAKSRALINSGIRRFQ